MYRRRRLVTLLLVVTAFIALASSFPSPAGTSSGITEIKYYLTTQRGARPHYQFILTPDEPTSSDSVRVRHPNSILWRTEFEPVALNFSSGRWTFNLWFEINATTSCSISLGYYDPFMPYPYVNVTGQRNFALDQIGLKEYFFTLTDVPAFTVPTNGSFAFRLDAPDANLYVYAQTPSNVYFHSETVTTTSEATTSTTSSETLVTETIIIIQPTAETTHSETSTRTEILTTPTSTRGTEHFMLTVHAHPENAQYPDEPSDELKVMIEVEYILEGIRYVKTLETLFSIEADKNSVINLTVSSYPSHLSWIEWDNYGAGRFSSLSVSIRLDSNRHAIAYFAINATETYTNTSSGGPIYVVPGYDIFSIIIGVTLAGAAIIFVRKRQNPIGGFGLLHGFQTD